MHGVGKAVDDGYHAVHALRYTTTASVPSFDSPKLQAHLLSRISGRK